MSAVKMARREIEGTYKTPELRAAYRAGLSTAAAICDEYAAHVKAGNPGQKRGSVSQIGAFGAHIAKCCGDNISMLRDEIKVSE